MKLCGLQLGAVMLALLPLGAGTAAAQVMNSGVSTVTLNALVGEGITISLSTSSVNFTLTPGSAVNPGSTGVTVLTSWNSRPGRDLSLYAFFTSSAVALNNGAGTNIPSSAFSISDNGGAFLPLTNTVPFGGVAAGLRLGAVTKIMGLNKRGTRTDNLLFNLNISALTLPAGTYSGVLTIRAQAI